MFGGGGFGTPNTNNNNGGFGETNNGGFGVPNNGGFGAPNNGGFGETQPQLGFGGGGFGGGGTGGGVFGGFATPAQGGFDFGGGGGGFGTTGQGQGALAVPLVKGYANDSCIDPSILPKDTISNIAMTVTSGFATEMLSATSWDGSLNLYSVRMQNILFDCFVL